MAEEAQVNEIVKIDRKVHANEIAKTWPKRHMIMKSQKHDRKGAC